MSLLCKSLKLSLWVRLGKQSYDIETLGGCIKINFKCGTLLAWKQDANVKSWFMVLNTGGSCFGLSDYVFEVSFLF